MLTVIPVWGNFSGANYVDVAPCDAKGYARDGHTLDTGVCWCGPIIEYRKADDGDAYVRPLVIHSGRER